MKKSGGGELTHGHAVLIGIPMPSDISADATEGDDIVLLRAPLGVEASEYNETPTTVNSNAQLSELPSQISGQRKVLRAYHGNIRKTKGYVVCLDCRLI